MTEEGLDYWASESDSPAIKEVRESKYAFSLKNSGDKENVIFLDSDHDVTTLYFHNLGYRITDDEGKEHNRYGRVLCARAKGDACEICDEIVSNTREDIRWKVEQKQVDCYTILRTDENGDVFKTIRMSSPKDSKAMKKLLSNIKTLNKGACKDRDSLRFAEVCVTKGDEEKSARIGEIAEIPIEFADPSQFTDVEPFTKKEIIEKFFVWKQEERQKIINYVLENGVS